jgi:hypothetical protein
MKQRLPSFFLLFLSASLLRAGNEGAGQGLRFSFSLSQLSGGSSVGSMPGRPSLGPARNFGSEVPDSSVPQNRPVKKWGRAGLELAVTVVPLQIDYWTQDPFPEDRDYRWQWDDQFTRFLTLKATRFDSNAFVVNSKHVVSGGVRYQCFRANNLTLGESFLGNLATDLYWEYIVEWREVISINDHILSVVGGTSVGEAFYQLTKYFCEQDGLLYRILGFLNPYLKINRALDRKSLRNARSASPPGWHDFNFWLGVRSFRASSQPGNGVYPNLGGRTQITHPPEYGRPGRIDRRVTDTLFSELSFDLTPREEGFEEIDFAGRIVAFGRFKQDLDARGRGVSSFFGIGSAFSFFQKREGAFYDSEEVRVKLDPVPEPKEPRKFRDKLSLVHLFGPVFDYTRFGDFKLRFVQEAYLDFGLINAFALNRYSEDHPILGAKTTLLYYGYYYGMGPTIASSLTVGRRSFEVAAAIKYHLSYSLQGRDRFQDELTDDFPIRDSRLFWSLGLGYRIPRSPIEIRASYERIDRRGKIKSVTVKDVEIRFFAGLNYKF